MDCHAMGGGGLLSATHHLPLRTLSYLYIRVSEGAVSDGGAVGGPDWRREIPLLNRNVTVVGTTRPVEDPPPRPVPSCVTTRHDVTGGRLLGPRLCITYSKETGQIRFFSSGPSRWYVSAVKLGKTLLWRLREEVELLVGGEASWPLLRLCLLPAHADRHARARTHTRAQIRFSYIFLRSLSCNSRNICWRARRHVLRPRGPQGG